MTNERDHIVSLREDNAVLRNRVTDLTRERDEYKIWWTRDSKSLGTAINDLSMERACKQDLQAEITQLRGNLSLAEEGLANYALEVEQLKGLLGAAACPNRSASGHEGAWQCQWCDERKSALSASHEPEKTP